MNSKLLFLLGCIPARLGITWIASRFHTYPLLGVPFLLIGLGFALIYIFGLRKRGAEVGGGLIWWNDLRPIHSFFYILTGLLLYLQWMPSKAYIPVLIDTLFGLAAFTFHYHALL